MQIVQYCIFLKSYLLGNILKLKKFVRFNFEYVFFHEIENTNVTHILEPILDKCIGLKTISINNQIGLYEKNEMPLSYEKHEMFVERSKY